VYHEDGKLKGVGPYRGDRKNGVWQELWSTGEPWRQVTYVDDHEADPAAAACADLRGDWVADAEKRFLGCQVCRALPDDSVEAIGFGHWTFWHPNGQIEKEGNLVSGEKVGVWRFNYDNGAKMLEGEFKGGKEAASKAASSTSWSKGQEPLALTANSEIAGVAVTAIGRRIGHRVEPADRANALVHHMLHRRTRRTDLTRVLRISGMGLQISRMSKRRRNGRKREGGSKNNLGGGLHGSAPLG